MKFTIFSIIAIAVTGLLLCSCNDKLDVLQAYDFNLSTMPIQKRIKQGETAEIRCQLNKSGNYKQTKFYISYFQFDGRGTLKMDNGTLFLPNDSYPLDKETFRLYYTSECSDQQQFDLYVTDSFGQRYDLSISFQNDSDKPSEE